MFTVKTPEEALDIIRDTFSPLSGEELVPLDAGCGRVLARDITAGEYVPGFDRSTVDGYAVSARDTFGCSDAIPALLSLAGEVLMGEAAENALIPASCVYVPTGGAVPEGADAVVMIEYTEDYGDGTIGILRPASPGMNMIYRGDDVYPGKRVLPAGRRLGVSDIGALAAMGITRVPVKKRPVVGIISTGDELIPIEETPAGGQIRDVNSSMLAVLCRQLGADPVCYGIIRDEPEKLTKAVENALAGCDLILISGGSSVGLKDATAGIIENHGRILFHGIAMKPGKPTILGDAGGKPIFGLPGHPVAAFFVSRLFVRAALAVLTGESCLLRTIPAYLGEALSANHGRMEVIGVHLRQEADALYADPVHTKSGLISSLAGADGYITIPRDCEGLAAGAIVEVNSFEAP